MAPADVETRAWRPRFEISHRRLVPVAQALGQVDLPAGLRPLCRRAFVAAGLSPG